MALPAIPAASLTPEHTIDVLDILDFFDLVGVEYEAHSRTVAESTYASVLEIGSETHRDTGEEITVVYTDIGDYAVPADLSIHYIPAED
jgi:hypothetical protein